MIRVFIRSDMEGKITVKVKGHALSAKPGEDLVCAAASAYVNQLAETIKAFDRNDWFVNKAKIHIEEGKAALTYKPKAPYRGVVEYLTMMTTTGFDWLQKEYPEYVKLN